MRERNFRLIKLTNFLVFIILEAASVLLVSNYDIVKDWEISRALSRPINTLSKAILSVGDYFSLRKTNNRLARENVELRNENQILWETIDSLTKHEDSTFVLDSDPTFTYLPAKIVSNSTDRLHNYIIIDKGESDSIKVGQGVVTEKGIIGYVVSVSSKYSKISSILDVDNMFSADLANTATFGTMHWNGKHKNIITMREIPLHTVFNDGDTVVSNGYSLIYPAHIPIGTVVGRDLKDGTNYSADIKLFEDFNRLKYVYVVSRNDIDYLKQEDPNKNRRK